MSRHRESLIWLGCGLVGLVLMLWAWQRALPLLPEPWEMSRSEAEALALERLRDLGEPVADPYVVVRMRTDTHLERRLRLLAAEVGTERLRVSRVAKAQVVWDVLVYAPGATPNEWSYRSMISLDGEILALLRRVSRDQRNAVPVLDPVEARTRAMAYLASQGFDLSELDSEQAGELDHERRVVQLTWGEEDLGPDFAYGFEVAFDDREPAGFSLWYNDLRREELLPVLQQSQMVFFSRVVFLYVLLPLVAIAFLRLYHDGQLGVRRGVHLFLLILATGTLYLVLNCRGVSQSVAAGLVGRQQVTWLVVAFSLVFQVLGLAALALMSWSVGEFYCRRQWPMKLASIDALFRGKWSNATVARSSLRGVAGGMLMIGVLLALIVPMKSGGAFAQAALILDSSFGGPLPWLGTVTQGSSFLPLLLFGCLLVPSWGADRFGPRTGVVLGVVAVTSIAPMFLVLPLQWGWAAWAVVAVIPVLLFRFGDLLSALWAGLSATFWLQALPALGATDISVQTQGWVVVLLSLAPLILSVRHLASDQEFVYLYDDVPPHVRRIAERERQRVELETAARIQSSILPDLPAQLNGVEIAHRYLPATEVGGDFYDVLALDDGRLAVAVGDVAGHGVSSGLVMSMARSALAVQVTFDPEVRSVFRTLNRMVYQGARRRLLTTLCYVLLDPARRRLAYSSAGHLFPYRVTAGGDVQSFEASSYPLGVRDEIDVHVHNGRMQPGDTLFLYSDGLVEACREDDDEPFGFERLESSLRRHAGHPPRQLCDGVLTDIEAYAGQRPRQDDLTVLVLRLPSAA